VTRTRVNGSKLLEFGCLQRPSGSGESWFTSGGLRLEPRRGNSKALHQPRDGSLAGPATPSPSRPWPRRPADSRSATSSHPSIRPWPRHRSISRQRRQGPRISSSWRGGLALAWNITGASVCRHLTQEPKLSSLGAQPGRSYQNSRIERLTSRTRARELQPRPSASATKG
jgi:hypothetical protein